MTPTRRAATAPVYAGLVALALAACAGAARRAPPSARHAAEALAPADGWRPLLAGNSLDGWRGYRSPDVPPGWAVADGVLGRRAATGDLVTREEFGDFEAHPQRACVGPAGRREFP